MNHHINSFSVEAPVERRLIPEITFDKPNRIVTAQGRGVPSFDRRVIEFIEVVKADHSMAGSDETFDHVGSDEPGPTCDKDIHAVGNLRELTTSPECFRDSVLYFSGPPDQARTIPPASATTECPAAVSHSIMGPNRG